MRTPKGSPTYYSDSEIPDPIFCGYDNQGNLFIDGGPFAELPSGSGTFTNFKLNKHIYQGGQVQWDDKHITVTSVNANRIYRLQISGSAGTIIGTTSGSRRSLAVLDTGKHDHRAHRTRTS